MTTQLQCVVREVAPGDHQFVPVAEVAALIAGETVFTGAFNSQVENFGPSKSHARTICLPAGELTKLPVKSCVVREVRPGDHQYVPVDEVPALVPGEKLVIGVFRSQTENLGPYKSHRRTICLPTGLKMTETVVH